jgi:cell division protein FtsI (penicillin-binding protein 3)
MTPGTMTMGIGQPLPAGAAAAGTGAAAGLPRGDRSSRRRLIALLVALLVAFALVAARLIDVQGFSAGPYAALGLAQRVHTELLPADRGSILDRNGNTLAMSAPQPTIWADPTLVTAPAREAAALAPILGEDVPTLTARLSRPGRFSYLAREVDEGTAKEVHDLNLPGVFLVDEPKRFDPDGPLAAPVIGLVGVDGQGLSGLEQQYNGNLAGKPGKLATEDDPSGRPIPGGVSRLTPATKGSDLVLTLDRPLQYAVEQDLSDEIVKSHAQGGMAIIMNRTTGEVLALANLSIGADGTTVAPASSNSAVTTVYEPGSVEKLITVSAALDRGVVHPTDVFALPDHLRIYDRTFTDDTPHPVEQWTPTDILTASSNIGAVTLAEKVGKRPLVNYLHRFGLGTETSLQFPYESGGILLDPSQWSGVTLATVAFGQGMAVTAMQLVAAYNAIANGGVYVAPKLVKATVDGTGRVVPTPPSATHRVVSADVAREVTAMLTEVVRGGTGTEAQIAGYQVAGKTGTARKALQGQSGYASTYVSSFAGFVPASDPAFTAMVVLDQPTPIFGGLVAAPVFQDISTYALRELEVPPPAPDPGLFAGVPHAQPSAATAADEPGKSHGFTATVPGQVGGLLAPPPPAVATTTTLPVVPTTAPPAPPAGATNPAGGTGTGPAGGAGTSKASSPPTTAPPPTTTTAAPRKSPPTTSLLTPLSPPATAAAAAAGATAAGAGSPGSVDQGAATALAAPP